MLIPEQPGEAAGGGEPRIWVIFLVGGLLQAIIRITKGVQAHQRPLEIAGHTLRAGFMPLLGLSLLAPARAARAVLLVAAVAVAVWDIWTDVREWRRSKVLGPSRDA